MSSSSTYLTRPPTGLHALTQSPYTLGGDTDLRLLKLDDAHFKQRDTSQNDAIWDLFDLELKFDASP